MMGRRVLPRLLVSLVLLSSLLVSLVPCDATGTATVHWSFDAMDSAGRFTDLVQGAYARSAAVTNAATRSDAGCSSTAQFGFGSYFNSPYTSSCSAGSCVAVDTAVLLVAPAPPLLDLTNGWAFSFWHQALPNAGYSSTPNAQVIFTDQGEDGTWTQQVHVLVTQYGAGSFTYTLVAYLQLASGQVLTSHLSIFISDPTAAFTPFTVSYGVDQGNNLLRVVLTAGYPAQIAEFDYTLSSISLPSEASSEYYLASSPFTPVYSSFTLADPSMSALAGYIDELWLFNGPLESAQVALLAQSNLATAAQQVSTSFTPGYGLTYTLTTSTSTTALTTSSEADTNDQVMYNEPITDGAVAGGAQQSMQATFTLHSLQFTFEPNTVMLALAPNEVSLQCQAESVGAPGDQQPPSASYCAQSQAFLQNLAPVYVTQSPSTGLFINAYVQTNYGGDETALMSALHRLLALLNWNNAEVPETANNQYTIVGSEPVQQPTQPPSQPPDQPPIDQPPTDPSQPITASSMTTLQPTAVRHLNTTLTVTTNSTASTAPAGHVLRNTLPSSYTTRGVHSTKLRPVRHTHTVHHNPRSLLLNISANSTSHNSSQVNATAAINGTVVSSSVSPALQQLLQSADVVEASDMCIEVLSEIDNDPDSQFATPFDQYSTTVASCYQAGVGVIASNMDEQVNAITHTATHSRAHQESSDTSARCSDQYTQSCSTVLSLFLPRLRSRVGHDRQFVHPHPDVHVHDSDLGLHQRLQLHRLCRHRRLHALRAVQRSDIELCDDHPPGGCKRGHLRAGHQHVVPAQRDCHYKRSVR
jgi:hypothetical protein